MAKNRIRGITVEIGGDTTKLGKALEGVNKQTRDLQGELNGVNKLLKLDPKNVDLLKQKQDLLSKSIEGTKEKLNILREAQTQVQRQFERGEVTEEQFRDLQREIVSTEKKLEKLTDEAREFGSVGAQQVRNVGEEINDLGGKMTSIGGKMTAGITAPIVAGAVAATEGTRELRGDLARLEVNAEQAGKSVDDMSGYMTQIVGVTNEVDSSVEGLSNLLASGFSDEGFAEVMDHLSGAAIKFSDTLKFEGIADGLQETLATGAGTGAFAELLERSGVVLDDFNAGLQTAIEKGEQEDYILQTLANTGLAEYYAAYREGNPDLVETAEAQYKLQEQLSKIGALIDPLLAKVTMFAATLLEKFNALPSPVQNTILVIAGLVAAIAPLIVAGGAIASGIGSMITLAPKLVTGITAIKGGLTGLWGVMAANPAGMVVIALTAVVAILVTLYNKCEWFRDGVNKIVSHVVGFFKSIPEKLNTLPTEMSNLGINIIKGLGNGITKMKDWVVTKIKNVGRSVLNGLNNVFDVNSPSKETEYTGEMVDEGLAVGIENNADRPIGAAETAMSNVKDKFVEGSDALIDEIKNKQNTLADRLGDFGDLFTIENDEEGNSIFNLGDLQSDIDNLIAYANAANALKGKGLGDALLGEISEMSVDDALVFMDELLGLTDEKLNEFITLYEQKQALAEQVATAFYSKPVEDAAGGAIADSTEETNPVNFDGVVEGATTEETKIITYAEELKTKLVNQGLSYKPEFENIGFQSMKGIEEGVKRGESGVVNAMVAAVKRAIAKAKAAAKIHSPSEETENVLGRPLMQGVAVGITKETEETAKVMSEAVNGVVSKGATVGRDINSTFAKTNVDTTHLEGVLSILTQYLPMIVDASGRQIVLDSGAVVGGTIDLIDAKLGQNALLKARGV